MVKALAIAPIAVQIAFDVEGDLPAAVRDLLEVIVFWHYSQRPLVRGLAKWYPGSTCGQPCMSLLMHSLLRLDLRRLVQNDFGPPLVQFDRSRDIDGLAV